MSDIKVIIDELSRTLSGIDRKQQEQMADEILKAKHIFVAGAGRSGMMARCFAMRLMHMGMKAYMVGEVVTPSMQEGDLLIITSGSGTTGSLVKMAEKAKALNGRVGLITFIRSPPLERWQMWWCRLMHRLPNRKLIRE